MNAEQVRAHIAAKYPQAMRSPFAVAVQSVVAADEAERAVQFAQMQARVTATERDNMLQDATEHARQCLDARSGWDVETLSANIESNFPELGIDECDEIARKALEERRNG